MDDLHVLMHFPDVHPFTVQRAQLALEEVVAQSLQLHGAIGHKVNVAKCRAWTAHPDMERGAPQGVATPEGGFVPWARSFRDLGSPGARNQDCARRLSRPGTRASGGVLKRCAHCAWARSDERGRLLRL